VQLLYRQITKIDPPKLKPMCLGDANSKARVLQDAETHQKKLFIYMMIVEDLNIYYFSMYSPRVATPVPEQYMKRGVQHQIHLLRTT